MEKRDPNCRFYDRNAVGVRSLERTPITNRAVYFSFTKNAKYLPFFG